MTLSLSQQKPVAPEKAMVIRGNSFSFSVTPSRGWAIDTVRWAKRQVTAGVYPTYENVGPYPPIWIETASKKKDGKQTLRNLVAYFSKTAIERDSLLSVKELEETWTTGDGKPIVVVHMENANYSSLRAYIDDGTFVAMVQLQQASKERVNALLPIFKSLLRSYMSVASVSPTR